jgi:hypothetical protein
MYNTLNHGNPLLRGLDPPISYQVLDFQSSVHLTLTLKVLVPIPSSTSRLFMRILQSTEVDVISTMDRHNTYSKETLCYEKAIEKLN